MQNDKGRIKLARVCTFDSRLLQSKLNWDSLHYGKVCNISILSKVSSNVWNPYSWCNHWIHQNRAFEPRYFKKGENCKEFCVIVSAHSLCSTTGKQFQDYVRAKSNYVVKLLWKTSQEQFMFSNVICCAIEKQQKRATLEGQLFRGVFISNWKIMR